MRSINGRIRLGLPENLIRKVTREYQRDGLVISERRLVFWSDAQIIDTYQKRYRGLVESIFPAFAVEAVLQVMACESHGNPNAIGAAGELGLLQIHPRWHPDATLDPEGNLRAAFRISGGGTNWSGGMGPRTG